ncbi:unnamed protein product [Gongylonema pulchrum]|uniref:G_PROTEIN_RECEP_F1_2 domain-containing protein n=1 Tax=Gongylonema pulchrum TaxID=637853 RepID=A0A183EDF7_9BILA|nr:unnamed protein product [Gongylonema pulchrum]
MRIIEIAAILMIPVLLFGLFGNLHLLYATYKIKHLQNRNGILVAIIAFLDMISGIHESKIAIEILSGKALKPRNVCFRSIVLYVISFNMACVEILFLAIDRFIAVWSPLRVFGVKRGARRDVDFHVLSYRIFIAAVGSGGFALLVAAVEDPLKFGCVGLVVALRKVLD